MSEQIEKRKAELVEQDGREISSRVGTYQDGVTVAMLKKRDQVTPREITRVQFGRVTHASEKQVRSRLWKAVRDLQDEGILCYPQYDLDKRGRPVKALKIFRADTVDLAEFPAYLDYALKRSEITKERYDYLRDLSAQKLIAPDAADETTTETTTETTETTETTNE